ncbi:MAG: hypothetical protein HY268_22250 [Deltaproteobacteria bacterium]|nr:hypothetical protein [Deltaproteobacteria bacterium]
MKAARIKVEETAFEEIIDTLKRVPKARLGVVRDLVQALAIPPTSPNSPRKAHARKQVSLVDSPFCGMWEDREDIADGQTYARQLRRRLETRGDRRKNVR